MSVRIARICVAMGFLALSAACGDSPTGANGVSSKRPAPAPTPTAPTPPTAGARTFEYTDTLNYRVRAWTQSSSYTLYTDGSFVLHYSNPGLDYRGRYSEKDGAITFNWDLTSTVGPWGAEGTIVGSKLSVRYTTLMELSDFENAVYSRSN